MTLHETYMQRCIELARNGRMHAAPNPMVGAVIVHNDRIIGEGYHACCGKAHAEVNAINSVRPADRALLKDSTLYVSLEPCAHFGRTPPCALLIVKTGIPRVVVGCVDPFAKVQGRGISLMREAGIEVTVGVLEEECQRLNCRFITAQTLRRPLHHAEMGAFGRRIYRPLARKCRRGTGAHFNRAFAHARSSPPRRKIGPFWWGTAPCRSTIRRSPCAIGRATTHYAWYWAALPKASCRQGSRLLPTKAPCSPNFTARAYKRCSLRADSKRCKALSTKGFGTRLTSKWDKRCWEAVYPNRACRLALRSRLAKCSVPRFGIMSTTRKAPRPTTTWAKHLLLAAKANRATPHPLLSGLKGKIKKNVWRSIA